ncbi:MAG: DUF1501 domain-containing protein [Myxococcales bacterium]|nr:DUF1501 domain-containing protein [Myxococcales bacterium]MBL0192749.1 DUF1501 domain-containing protein [Myxococcales bacterium]HQY60060.1 DUF1501 domain-containing protein [Polyangiaceae bacterium]
MQRRNFLKVAGLAGLSLMGPWGPGGRASADPAVWGGPFLLHMHASGGWDPTLFCDGKLTAEGSTPEYENRLVTAVEVVNGVPVPSATATGKYLLTSGGAALEDPVHFFQTIGRDVLVVNGIDTQTNSHETGVQGLGCGHNDVELPAIAALFAGTVALERKVPMAFLASGAYNRTGDVIAPSRFPGNKVDLLTDPFKGVPANEKGLLTDLGAKRILELRAQRMAELQGKSTLPRERRTLAALAESTKSGDAINLLKSVTEGPPPAIDSFVNDLAPDTRGALTAVTNGVSRFVDLGRPLETMLRCFAAGISISATWAQGGFDTHAQHDQNQTSALASFVARIRYVQLRAAQLGLKDKLYVLVTSDFGRTPKYNTGNGKDHWNVTSALLMGPGIRGGRAIGKTDEGHKALNVSKSNASENVPAYEPNGTRIHPSHVHRELRRVLGVEKAPFIGQFVLPSTHGPLPLLA